MFKKEPASAPAETPNAPQPSPQVVYYIVQQPYPPPPPPQGAGYYGPQYGPYNPQPYQQQAYQDAEMGQQPADEAFTSSFEDEEVRRAFITKVLSILAVQIIITAMIISMFMFIASWKRFLIVNWWIGFVACGFMIPVTCMLICCESRRIFPLNYILLALFTILSGVMLATVCVYYSIQVIVMSMGITAMICFTVSIAACFCPVDITGCGCMLLIALLTFATFSIVAAIVQAFVAPIPVLQYIIGGIGTVLFSLYLMHDLQLIMGGKKVELSPEEYVIAVLQLYIDIIMIFQYVLMLFGGDRN